MFSVHDFDFFPSKTMCEMHSCDWQRWGRWLSVRSGRSRVSSWRFYCKSPPSVLWAPHFQRRPTGPKSSHPMTREPRCSCLYRRPGRKWRLHLHTEMREDIDRNVSDDRGCFSRYIYLILKIFVLTFKLIRVFFYVWPWLKFMLCTFIHVLC